MRDKEACYRRIEGELVKFRYLKRSRQGKGVVIRYLTKISGYSRQQLIDFDNGVIYLYRSKVSNDDFIPITNRLRTTLLNRQKPVEGGGTSTQQTSSKCLSYLDCVMRHLYRLNEILPALGKINPWWLRVGKHRDLRKRVLESSWLKDTIRAYGAKNRTNSMILLSINITDNLFGQ